MKLKAIVFGTFDIFHPGHCSFLKQAKKYGEYLIVVIARDKTVVEIKKKKSINNESRRLQNLKSSGLADKVVLGSLFDKYAAIKKYRPDIICLGYDQKYFVAGLKDKTKELMLQQTKVIRMKPYKPEIYKTSKLRKLKK